MFEEITLDQAPVDLRKKLNTFGIAGVIFITGWKVGCPPCHQINSVIALKECRYVKNASLIHST